MISGIAGGGGNQPGDQSNSFSTSIEPPKSLVLARAYVRLWLALGEVQSRDPHCVVAHAAATLVEKMVAYVIKQQQQQQQTLPHSDSDYKYSSFQNTEKDQSGSMAMPTNKSPLMGLKKTHSSGQNLSSMMKMEDQFQPQARQDSGRQLKVPPSFNGGHKDSNLLSGDSMPGGDSTAASNPWLKGPMTIAVGNNPGGPWFQQGMGGTEGTKVGTTGRMMTSGGTDRKSVV